MSSRFRFESILRQRLTERDAAGLALADTQQQIDQLDAQKTQFQQQREQLRSTRARTGRISIASLQTADQHDAFLRKTLETLAQQISELNSKYDEQKAQLLNAQQEVKKLENLRDKERAAWLADQQRREQLRSDDQSNAAHYLTKRTSTSAPNAAL